MHQRARGHEVEPVAPIFYVQKRRIRKKREKGTAGKSHAQCARGHEVERSHSHFLCSQQRKITIRESWALYATL